MKKLTEINLATNELTSKHIDGGAFKEAKNLQRLDLMRNKLENVPKNMGYSQKLSEFISLYIIA